MEILNLSLPATNRFATDYLAQDHAVEGFFHYHFLHSSEYERRVMELRNRSFKRKELCDHIEQFMDPFPSSNQVKKSLEKLRSENSVVVIGGQQAGLLTGPLYSIHKVISIIMLARQQEMELGVPVVPVFWIAGEDHDFQEVNHLYINKNRKVEKWIYPEKIKEKKMVSHIELNQEICLSWIDSILETYGETKNTKDLLDFSKKALEKSTTMVDFFSWIIMELFKEDGLLIIDSGDYNLRKLESEYFIKQIQCANEITSLVKEQQAEINLCGFPNTIEIPEQAGNLFYYDEEFNERILLEYDEENLIFKSKNGQIHFTKEQLLQIASQYPEKLSNNVVTRPIMQEWLFPTLAFIAGPGEISYWAELKKAFEFFDIKMPPIVPRLNLTFVERQIEANLRAFHLSIEDVLKEGISKSREEFLASVRNKKLQALFAKTKEEVINRYRELEECANEEDKGLAPLLEKNSRLIMDQLQFMENKMELALQFKNDVVLKKYAAIENSLKPLGSPQERIWNIYYYLNQYGFSFIHQIMQLPFEFDGKHKVIIM